MELPFSHEDFLGVFGAYNSALWPAVVLLWIASVALAWRWMRDEGGAGKPMFGLLAVHWAWSGAIYHWLFFQKINPAAALFGALFVLQAMLLTWLAVTSRARFAVRRNLRGVLGGYLVGYGLAYPLVGLAVGLQYPRLPLFAVPCPTTLFTAGVLLTSVGAPRFVNVVPLLWALVGSSAAIVLGIHADFPLLLVALLLGLETLAPSALGNRAAG